MGPPSRKTCWRSRANSSASASLRVAGAQVHALRGAVEDPAVGGPGRAGPSRRAAAGGPAAGRRSSRTVSCGSSVSTVPVPTSIVSHRRPQAVGVEPGGARGDPAAGAVGGGAAPVEGGGELPGHEGTAVVHRERPLAVDRPGLVLEQPALDLDARGPQGRRSPGGDRVGVGAGRTPPGDAGLDQRPRAGPGAAGVVAGLEGDDGGAATGAGPAWRRASTSACGEPAPRCHPSATVRPAASRTTQPTRGLGPVGTPGVVASASARRMAACSALVLVMTPPVGSHGPRGVRSVAGTTSRWTQRHRPSCVFPSGL